MLGRALTRLLCAAVVLLGARAQVRAQPAPAPAFTEEARAHFNQGAAFTQAGDYEAAARAFAASYDSDPSREALFAWAQVERLRGRCARAIELYRKVLDSNPTPTQVEAVSLNISRCERTIEEASRARATPATLAPADLAPKAGTLPAPTRPAPGLADRTVASSAEPASTPRIGAAETQPPPGASTGPRLRNIILAGGAGVALATAGTFFVLSRSDERAAQDADNWGDYYDLVKRARTRQWISTGALGAGVLVGGTALIGWLLAPSAPGTVVAFTIPGGGSLGWRGQY